MSAQQPITAPLTASQADILAIGINVMQAGIPGWLPNPSSPEYVRMQAFAAMASYVVSLAGNVPDDIIRFIGQVVYQTPPFAATSATGATTWVVADTAGHTIPDGTHLTVLSADGTTTVDFQTVGDIVIAPTTDTTSAGEVPIIASDPGANGTALTGPLQVTDDLGWVVEITLTGPTVNGADAETTVAYATRILQLAPLLAPRLCRPEDFAAAASLLVPGVFRALAIDEYNADTMSFGQYRCVTVANIDVTGAAVSTDVKAAALAEFVAKREESFKSFVIDPTYTTINIAYTAIAAVGYDATDVQTRTDAALVALASPANWGVLPGALIDTWVNVPVFRYQDVVQALKNVQGMGNYTGLTLNGGTADVALTGVAPLPTPGTIGGTVLLP